MRRVSLALLVSLGFHGGIAAVAFGVAAWRGLSFARDVELVPITLESVRELPLGPPPGPKPAEPVIAPPPRRPKAVAHKGGTMPLDHRDAGAPPDTRPAPPAEKIPQKAIKPGDLQSYGPEGSRLTALLRMDRLRASPEGRAYIGPVDEILRLLPDRRRLLEGTGLDLYRDFDALLIATPNPFDDSVTFLAARHHVSDANLRTALDRGATAAGRPIEWREEAGRPVGVRAQAGRDDRLFVLPQPGLAVIAPPAYAQLLLQRAAATTGRDGGAPPPARRDWADLVARIDAEDGSIPEEAVFMMTATNILRGRGGATAPVPGGLPAVMPKSISMIAGTSPTSFLELTAHFAAETEAQAWEDQFPRWKQQLLGNPLVLLAGLNPIVSRAELRRQDRAVILRTTATPEETRRILQMIVNFAHNGLQLR
jgi:hypothetical protein